jgi:DNA primase
MMSNRVDFAAIKQSVPLAPLLRRYQVKLRRSGRDQYRGRCPIHRGEGAEAFHANLSRNIFHCFSCGAGGSVLDFVAAMEGCDLREAARRLRQDAFLADESVAAVGDQKQLVTKEKARLPRSGLLCTASTARTPTWPRGALRGAPPRSSVQAYIEARESSADGW